MLNVDLGVMIAVGVPVGILSLVFQPESCTWCSRGSYGLNLLEAVSIQDFRPIYRR